MTKAVLEALNSCNLPPDLDHTFITLILKKKRPEVGADFHLISLCNVVYKLMAKVLANRFKAILPRIIYPTQSAFVPGRLISNSILLAYKIMHFLNHKRQGKELFIFLELDISKAYGRVEWGLGMNGFRKL